MSPGEEIRKAAGPLWRLIPKTSWPGNQSQYDPIKNGAACIVSQLAYCALTDDERKSRNRAKVVPCEVYQSLMAGMDFDVLAELRRQDLPSEVVHTRFFVAMVIPVHQILFIGIRGTLFAYDWLINLRIYKKRGINGLRFHAGFLSEAEKLLFLLNERVLPKYSGWPIYFTGHSLGGAVAAILNEAAFPNHVSYVFGSPRLSSGFLTSTTFATRRALDVVPHLPPRIMNYADFEHQRTSSGLSNYSGHWLEMYFYGSWLLNLAFRRFLVHHSIEQYRRDVLEPLGVTDAV